MDKPSPCLLATFLTTLALTLTNAHADEPGPSEVLVSRNGQTLYVNLPDSSAIGVLDVATGLLNRTLPCPGPPSGLSWLDPDRSLAATCGPNVLVLQLPDGAISYVIPVGRAPRAPVAAPDASRIYACLPHENQIVVIDPAAGSVVQRVPTLREPVDAALSPDGQTLAVANLLPTGRADANDISASVSLFDTRSFEPRHVRLPNGSTSLRGVCFTPDGARVLAAHIQGRYQMPTTQLDRGWLNTNVLSIVDLATARTLGTVLLDDIDRGAANPFAVAVSPDASRIVISHAGTHELSLIDAPALFDRLRATFDATVPLTPDTNPANDLAILDGVRVRISLTSATAPSALMKGPRGLAVHDTTAYVALAYDHALAAVPLAATSSAAVRRTPLGTPPVPSPALRGQLLFEDATLCFQSWQSCASCHPDGRADALNWDLLNDSLGNPKNTKSLLLSSRTPPSMFLGVRADAPAAIRAGFEHILFAPVTDDQARDVEAYIDSLATEPDPSIDTARVQRGRTLFSSVRLACDSCHPPPLYTDLKMHDVASRSPRDRTDSFDTPTPVEIGRTAPYLHDGRHPSLESLLRDGRHGDRNDQLGNLSDDALADLIAFLRSL